MSDYMAQMLNELMGPQRDALPGEKKDMKYDDPDVCTDFLVGFCTHDSFKNTKNDLGFCKYPIHDENMRISYTHSSKRGRLGFEERFLDRIRRIHDEVQRKIQKNEERLQMTQGDSKVAEELFEKKIAELTERRDHVNKKIETMMEEAQVEGEKGNVMAAQSAVDRADKAKIERDELDKEEQKLRMDKSKAMTMEENVTAGNRQMQVCQVCGCFMLQNDAQQRIDDHLSGKLHLAYLNIGETIINLEKEIEDRKASRRDEKEKEDRGDRRRDRDRDEKKDREKDDRKDKEKDERKDKEKEKEKDKERERRRDRGDHKDERKRSRSRDRRDRDRDRHGRDHRSDRDRRDNRDRDRRDDRRGRDRKDSDRDRRRH